MGRKPNWTIEKGRMRMKAKAKKTRQRVARVTEGSGNVFADLGLPNPEQELLKAQPTLQIYTILKGQWHKASGDCQGSGRTTTSGIPIDAQPRRQLLRRSPHGIPDGSGVEMSRSPCGLPERSTAHCRLFPREREALRRPEVGANLLTITQANVLAYNTYLIFTHKES
jgi:hypothetical protein